MTTGMTSLNVNRAVEFDPYVWLNWFEACRPRLSVLSSEWLHFERPDGGELIHAHISAVNRDDWPSESEFCVMIRADERPDGGFDVPFVSIESPHAGGKRWTMSHFENSYDDLEYFLDRITLSDDLDIA